MAMTMVMAMVMALAMAVLVSLECLRVRNCRQWLKVWLNLVNSVTSL